MGLRRRETAERAEDATEVAGIELPGGQVAPDPTTLEQFLTLKGQAERALLDADAVGPIVDEASSKRAADALKVLRHVRTDIDNARKTLSRGYNDAKAAVNAQFGELKAPVDGREQGLKAGMIAWQEGEAEREAAEREAEEEKVAAAQAAENAAAEEEGRASHHISPPAPATQTKGARGKSGAKATVSETVEYDITDPDLLPDKYVERVPRKSVIRADVKLGVVIPGVTPRIAKGVRTT